MKAIRKFFKFAAAFLLLPIVIFISVYSLDQKGFFQIKTIEINASTLSSQKNYIKPKIESLNKKLSLFKGASLWRFPLSQVAQIIKSEVWIKDFQLSRSWPSGLVVEIEPEAIAFIVQTNESGPPNTTVFRPVTFGGEILAKVDSTQAPNTVLIHDTQFLKNKKIRDGALSLLNALPVQGRMQPVFVSEIGFDKKEGYWMRLIQSEIKINLGEDQFEIKTARVAQVLDYLENRDLKARVIDANLSKKVLVRMH
jgi:cell division protein FtsQ